MSDRDLRRILNDVIDEIDRGRLRPLPPRRLRGRVGGAVLAAALGLGMSACDGRVVGNSMVDGGAPPDVMQVDAPDSEPPPDAAPELDAAPEPDAAPQQDAGVVQVLDGGLINLYMAIGFPDSGISAVDSGADADLDADIDAPAYMAPFPEVD